MIFGGKELHDQIILGKTISHISVFENNNTDYQISYDKSNIAFLKNF